MAATSSSTRRSENALFKISGSTSSSTTQKQQHFDVFINHRGPDVKLNLASSIYHVLDLLGVKAFFDREELNLGELIPQAIGDAINNALIHIAIFSKGYAESPWCLEELSLMLETGAPIIPVFYCVEPADLKWGTRKQYKEAFSEHERSGRYDSEMLEKWKSALHEASVRSGCEFEENGDSGLLLKEIVNRVQQEIKNERVPCNAATYTVGLDDAVRGIESTIKSAPAHVHIVGIVGMGGCGKTTLATEIYNRNFKAFDNCSFLSEVKVANLTELQKRLLEDILYFRDLSMNDAPEFFSTLSRRLKSSSPRVLIVFDDVDHGDQLDALLPGKGATLGAGSLIIVTARDLGVLTRWGISWIHQMTKLDQRHAKKLFCWHAFKGASPPDAFEGLMKEFVSACHGLPLSIKVIAERLYKQPEEIWTSELEKISKLLPEDITRRLKLSYDALDIQEKNMFLDVACFFVGEKKNLAKAVWEAAGWSSLESLVKKCLVEVDKQNRLRMHDHLLDLGRTIANECSPCRLWCTEQITRIRSCTKEIRGIMAATTKFDESYAHDEFPTCRDQYPTPFERCKDLEFCSLLQLLVVAGNCFPSDIARLTVDLVWLRWFNCQHTELPSWLSFKNLRVLELYGACSLELWEENAHPPKQLREILITAREGNSFRTFPSKILGLECLTKIALISYHGEEFLFKRLPPEFCDLQSLQHLELRYCKKLSELPTRFGKLRKLRYLDLCCCQDLRSLPDSFMRLVNLEHLDLSGCGKLLPMPYMLQNMTKLVKLYFSGQAKLKVLPLHIPKQKFLRELYMKKTELLHVPEEIGQLGKLETLVIGSPHLTGFPTSLRHLSSLTNVSSSFVQLDSSQNYWMH